MSDNTLKLDEATFDEIVGSSEEPILVDFWAEWCAPCKMIAPILDEIADEHGRLRIGKVDIDSNLGLAQRYDIMSIPTMIVFQDGQPVKRLVGAKGKGQLLEDLSDYL